MRTRLAVRVAMIVLAASVVRPPGPADAAETAKSQGSAKSAQSAKAARRSSASPSRPADGAEARGASRRSASVARAEAIVSEALKVDFAYRRLQVLTDTIGHRLAGSVREPLAVEWGRAQFAADGVRVRLEPVMVPVWVRGEESAAIVEGVPGAPMPLAMLGLGNSVGTPPEGVTASVVVVDSFEQLTALGRAKVEGKIVLYDRAFARSGDEMKDYGDAVKHRGNGASAAAKLGAAAALVRSVATASLRTPHTGGLKYEDDAPKIPAAAVSIEDALLLRRLVESGRDIRVRLSMEARFDRDREGANVVAEIRGREKPDEIVLIGAHLDSWDVGTGAIDDGAGCVVVLETMRLIAAGPAPRRTVRAVLYANEENGLRGGKAYRDTHMGEFALHVAAMEADSGAGRALGFGVKAGEGGEAMLRDLVSSVLAPMGSSRIRAGEGGADISVLAEMGVPLIGIQPDTTRYFDWHHTPADTLDKVQPSELQHQAAAFAAVTWLLADSDTVLPRVPPKSAKDED